MQRSALNRERTSSKRIEERDPQVRLVTASSERYEAKHCNIYFGTNGYIEDAKGNRSIAGVAWWSSRRRCDVDAAGQNAKKWG